MSETKVTINNISMPLLPLRGLVVFPYMTLPFDVGRKKSIKALEEAMLKDQKILLVAQKDPSIDAPKTEDIYQVGTVSRIRQLLKLPGDTIRVLVEGLDRAEIVKIIKTEPFLYAEVTQINTLIENEIPSEVEALKRQLMLQFEDYLKLTGKAYSEIIISLSSIKQISQVSDIIAANIALKIEQRQKILSEFNPVSRMEELLKILINENEILSLEKEINVKVRKQIDKMQKEYYLREQIKAIQTELGDKDGILAEIEDYRKKIVNKNLTEDAEKAAFKELDRLSRLAPGSAEGSVIRTYLDWILDLPWNEKTQEIIDLSRCEGILANDHYGLDKVKERIIEYLAVRKFKNSLKGPIICLSGPPGTGKTSIARSVAKALNRKYVRMSLGGIRDEAEIRGHRRTYVGAMPGRIINALKTAGSCNPLILLDEIDKMSSDFRGDPASAMLEVLDGEQNFAFRDHYLEIPFDLSDVLFITTANNPDSIPAPLLDRMEVIRLSGYTWEEKLNIAVKHLIPKQIKEHGLKKSSISFEDKAVRDIIDYYTREAGVRALEREISKVCRKAVKHLLTTGKKSVRINSSRLEEFLGVKKFRVEKISDKNEPGIATGLAWTPVGGDVLHIEVNVMNGSGKLELTGQLGEVMKESAKTAFSYIRSRTERLNIDSNYYNKFDFHIHVPEGAIPKDGPSAGITLATAMVSAITGIPVKSDLAMTGEITLRGRVLPIGGLKEKILAAYRSGIKTVLIPIENEKDIEEIPQNIKNAIDIRTVENMDEVLEQSLYHLGKINLTDKTGHVNKDILIDDATVPLSEINNECNIITQ